MRIRIRYYKSCALRLNMHEIKGLYDKIIITIVQRYITRLLSLALLLVLHTHNNTDNNKLVIFSSIALYYGDTYILLSHSNRVGFKQGYITYSWVLYCTLLYS